MFFRRFLLLLQEICLKFWRSPSGTLYVDFMGTIAESLDFAKGEMVFNTPLNERVTFLRASSAPAMNMGAGMGGLMMAGAMQQAMNMMGGGAGGAGGAGGMNGMMQSMAAMQQAQAAQAAQQGNQAPAPAPAPAQAPQSVSTKLAELVKLRDAGALTQAEFDDAKRLVLQGM